MFRIRQHLCHKQKTKQNEFELNYLNTTCWRRIFRQEQAPQIFYHQAEDIRGFYTRKPPPHQLLNKLPEINTLPVSKQKFYPFNPVPITHLLSTNDYRTTYLCWIPHLTSIYHTYLQPLFNSRIYIANLFKDSARRSP